MNFTSRDMGILISMSIAVVLMTFTFTALGLANEEVEENNMPEFNTSGDGFDLVGQFPDKPGSPSQFRMTWDESLGGQSDNSVWLDGDTSGGTEAVILNDGNKSDPRPEVVITDWDNGNSTSTRVTFNETGQYEVINDYGYELYLEYVTVENVNESNMRFEIQLQIRDQPQSDASFLERIPIIGGIYSGAEATGAAVLWIGSILIWTLGTMFEVILNLSIMLFGVMTFFVSLLHWLVIGYTGVISGASAWASVFVAIPGILLSVEFSKLIFIGIKLLPTT